MDTLCPTLTKTVQVVFAEPKLVLKINPSNHEKDDIDKHVDVDSVTMQLWARKRMNETLDAR